MLNDDVILLSLPVSLMPGEDTGWGYAQESQHHLYNALTWCDERGVFRNTPDDIPEGFGAVRVLAAFVPEVVDYLNEQVKFALEMGLAEHFVRKLAYFATYAWGNSCGPLRTMLMKDYAPHSFHFMMQEAKLVRDSGGLLEWSWKARMNGGIIYSGPEQPLDGSAPAFTVSVDPAQHGWSIHT